MTLPINLWLSSSLLLPCMFLIRWAGRKRSRLSWLTHSLKRWLALWSLVGLLDLGVILLLASLTNALALESIARIVCPGAFVLAGFHGESRLAVIISAISAAAIGNAAIYFVLAAFSWWLFERIAKKLRTHEILNAIEVYSTCLLISSCVFGLVNAPNFIRPVSCWDCFFPYGVPFTLFREGGYAGGGGLVWPGLLADLLVVIVFGIALALAFTHYFPSRPTIRATTAD